MTTTEFDRKTDQNNHMNSRREKTVRLHGKGSHSQVPLTANSECFTLFVKISQYYHTLLLPYLKCMPSEKNVYSFMSISSSLEETVFI